jgi:Protein of unknown function (DUF4241)
VQPARRRELVLSLVGVGIAIAVWVHDCRNPRPGPPSNVPIVIADGRAGECAAAAVDRDDFPCPYGDATGKVDGFDYGAAFEDTAGRCVRAGKLRLTTGRLAAVDPLASLDAAVPLEPAIAPGDYPVVLRLQDGDVALALVLIGSTRPTRWAPARAEGETAAYFYDVDSGAGCYADAATAELLRGRKDAELERRVALVKQRGIDPASDAWKRSLDSIPTSPTLLQVMRGEGVDAFGWANVCVDGGTGANLIAYHSGAGDGSYSVFAGYDAVGKVVAFVTDFQILESPAPRR